MSAAQAINEMTNSETTIHCMRTRNKEDIKTMFILFYFILFYQERNYLELRQTNTD